MSNINSFLKNVLGEDGLQACNRVNQKMPAMQTILAPRTILSWLTLAVRTNYDGEIPGVNQTYMSLSKHEQGISGIIISNGDSYEFANDDILDVASTLSVVLGVENLLIDPILKNTDISKLGKSIDMLVKARVISNNTVQEESSSEESKMDKVEEPGGAAAPKKPKKPEMPQVPVAVAPTMNKPMKTVSKSFELHIKKSQSEKMCPECGIRQFRADKFSGCMCFRSLAKTVSTKVVKDGYVLSLNKSSWDSETIQTLIASLEY